MLCHVHGLIVNPGTDHLSHLHQIGSPGSRCGRPSIRPSLSWVGRRRRPTRPCPPRPVQSSPLHRSPRCASPQGRRRWRREFSGHPRYRNGGESRRARIRGRYGEAKSGIRIGEKGGRGEEREEESAMRGENWGARQEEKALQLQIEPPLPPVWALRFLTIPTTINAYAQLRTRLRMGQETGGASF